MRKYGRRGSKRSIDADTTVYDSNALARTRKRQKITMEIIQPDDPVGSSKVTSPSKVRNKLKSSSSSFIVPRSAHHPESLDSQEASFLPLFTREPRSITPVVAEPFTLQLPASGTTNKPNTNLESRTSSSSMLHSTPVAPEVSAGETDNLILTPRMPANVFSQLFDISSSPGSLAKSHRVVRRMLSRSRTESSIGSDSAVSTLSPSSSFQEQLECTPQRAVISRQSTSSTRETMLEAVSPLTATQHAVVPFARTYGGKSRSFLMTLPTSQGTRFGDMHEDAEEEFELRESYTDLRARWGVDNSEDDPRMFSSTPSSPDRTWKGKAQKVIPSLAAPLPNGMMNDLKSITELRSKGESRRFLDEVGYLFEGLDPKGGIGLRRASALEIVTKLCDTDFARKAKAADFLGRSWVVLREAGAGEGDKILDVILVFFAALVARDSKSFHELAHKTDLVDTVFAILRSASLEKDWLSPSSSGISDTELKKSGTVSRAEKTLLMGLHSIISSKSGLFSKPVIISVRLLASQALVGLSPNLIRPQYLSAIQYNLKKELSLISPRVTAYMAGLSLFPPPSPSSDTDEPSFEYLERCLRLLDSFLLAQWSDPDLPSLHALDADCEALVDGLVALCIAVNVVVSDAQRSCKQKTADTCLELTFRVLVSLTHENQAWCQTVIHHDFALPLIMRTISQSIRDRRSSTNGISNHEHTLHAGEDGDDQASDRICLALGLLTNLIQFSEEARDLSQGIEINPTCPTRRHCLRGCQCMHRIRGLELLVLVYVEQDTVAGNMVDTGADFFRGHLAILFGLLLQRDRHQLALLQALPGKSRHIKLNSLVNQAREFVTFYSELTSQFMDVTVKLGAGRGDDVDLDTLNLLRSADQSFGRITRGGTGEDVARDVITFLEQLRDCSSDP